MSELGGSVGHSLSIDEGNSIAHTTGGTTLKQQPTTLGSTISADKNFNDLLYEYIYLELGKSKKDLFNLLHLNQSMRVDNSNNTIKLLNTILHAKRRNTQLEDFKLTCLDIKHNYDCDHQPPIQCNRYPQVNNTDIAIDEPLLSPYSTLEESNFKSQFFVTRSSFHIICTHLMQEYGSIAYKRSEMDVEKQLLVTLTYLGTVQSYRDIGTKFNIAVSTAHKCVNEVTNTLFKRMGELIYWPIDQQADSEIKAFNEMTGNRFPGILGVIGTVDLKKSCTANPSKHTKDGSSIAIQCVCNNRYQFYNVSTSYLLKSSVTTSTFLESPLGEMMLNDPETLFPNNNTHIVGLCCYPLLTNLMTPFSDNTSNTEMENTYNDAIKIPLNIINLAFGKLLGRFNRLICLDLWGQEKFAILIFAACCLHNLCLGNNDDINCEPYECCTFKCDYYDEYSFEKRRKICNML